MPEAVRARGPGRVNLIGEHTDYNEGLALPFAIARGVTVTAESGGEGIEATAKDLGETDAFALANREPSTGWRAFTRGIVAELQDAGYALRGATLEITGDVPQGSGLSSSAAICTALCLAQLALAGEAPHALARQARHDPGLRQGPGPLPVRRRRGRP